MFDLSADLIGWIVTAVVAVVFLGVVAVVAYRLSQ
jgi:hypothetical protein